MVIRTINAAYNVIRTLEGSGEITAYLCIREGKPKEEKFLIMKANRQELSRKMLIYFMDLSKHKKTEDFVECFTKERVVWVVFRHFEGTLFREKIANGLSVEERLCIGKNLMERFLFQNLPEYLRYEAFRLGNVIVDDSLEVHTNYLMLEPDRIDHCSFSAVLKRIAVCFKLLFDGELEEDVSQELYEFVKNVYRARFPDEASVFCAYRELEGILWQQQGEGKLKAKGYLTRIWERISGLSGGLFKLLYAALVMGLLGVFVYVCIMPETAPNDRTLFQSIGTLTIIENRVLPESGTEEMQILDTERKDTAPEENQETQENQENKEVRDTENDPVKAEMG